MKLFYGSFGIGHKLAEYVQPINASSELDAHKKMFKKHGKDWCAIYKETEIKNDEYKKLEVI